MGTYFRRTLAGQGVDIAVLGCYDNIIHPDAARRESILQKFEAYLRNARHFGAPMVATETGSVNREGFAYTRANFTDEAYQEAVAVIRRLVEFGERVGTIVAIEPGINHPIYNLDRVEQLLDEVDSPFLGIVFDATALLDPHEPVDLAALTSDAFERFGGRIVAAHLDDYRLSDGRVIRCDIDDGVLPVAQILATISAHAPALAVIMEETVNDAIARTVERYSESGFSK
jgi:sugar phosphate isomerase/epimerase